MRVENTDDFPAYSPLGAGPFGMVVIIDYWLENYCDEVCTLCGNSGVIDTRGVTAPNGGKVGRLNWCICPNGISLREAAQRRRAG
jgi:hypothetical protein